MRGWSTALSVLISFLVPVSSFAAFGPLDQEPALVAKYFPSVGTLVAGLVVVLPFAYSAYRTLRRNKAT